MVKDHYQLFVCNVLLVNDIPTDIFSGQHNDGGSPGQQHPPHPTGSPVHASSAQQQHQQPPEAEIRIKIT